MLGEGLKSFEELCHGLCPLRTWLFLCFLLDVVHLWQ